MAFQLPFHVNINLGRRTRLALRYAGMAVLALVVFVFALQLTFPFERVKDKAVEALASSYDIQIREVERGIIPGRVYFNDVTLRTRPTKPDEVVTTFFIKRLKVDAGLLALIGMNASVDLDAEIGVGHLKGNITLPKFGKGGIKFDLEGKDLPGANLPLRAALGLPITGKIEFAFDLDLPMTKNKMGRSVLDWTKADGSLDLSCPSGCTIGDGHTKLKPLLKNRTNQVMVGEGIDFGKVNIDSLVAHAVFTPAVGDPDAHSSSYKPGKLELQKFEVKSSDGELHVEYAMTMAQEFGESIVSGCLRFKASDKLLQKEETKKTYAAISTTGAELRSDGLFHIKLTDRFKDMKRLNMECGPNVKAVGNGEDFTARPGGAISRPGLTPTGENDGERPAIRTGIGTAGPGGATVTPTQPAPPPPPPPAAAGSAVPVPTQPQTSTAPPAPVPAEAAGSATAGSAEPSR